MSEANEYYVHTPDGPVVLGHYHEISHKYGYIGFKFTPLGERAFGPEVVNLVRKDQLDITFNIHGCIIGDLLNYTSPEPKFYPLNWDVVFAESHRKTLNDLKGLSRAIADSQWQAALPDGKKTCKLCGVVFENDATQHADGCPVALARFHLT